METISLVISKDSEQITDAYQGTTILYFLDKMLYFSNITISTLSIFSVHNSTNQNTFLEKKSVSLLSFSMMHHNIMSPVFISVV